MPNNTTFSDSDIPCVPFPSQVNTVPCLCDGYDDVCGHCKAMESRLAYELDNRE